MPRHSWSISPLLECSQLIWLACLMRLHYDHCSICATVPRRLQRQANPTRSEHPSCLSRAHSTLTRRHLER